MMSPTYASYLLSLFKKDHILYFYTSTLPIENIYAIKYSLILGTCFEIYWFKKILYYSMLWD